jgi:hypothetical protein
MSTRSFPWPGIDLNNPASVKAAIDTWKLVEDGVFVRATNFNPIQAALGLPTIASVDDMVNAILALKDTVKKQSSAATPDYSAFCLALGIPATSTADQIVGNITTLKKNFADQVKAMASGSMPKGKISDDGTGININVQGQGPAIQPNVPAPTLANLPAAEIEKIASAVGKFVLDFVKSSTQK